MGVLGFFWIVLDLIAGSRRNPFDLSAASVGFLTGLKHFLAGIVVGFLFGLYAARRDRQKRMIE